MKRENAVFQRLIGQRSSTTATFAFAAYNAAVAFEIGSLAGFLVVPRQSACCISQ